MSERKKVRESARVWDGTTLQTVMDILPKGVTLDGVTIETGTEYDSTYAELVWKRPETDTEEATRIAREKAEGLERTARELRTLAELKAKYESHEPPA